MPPPGAGGNPAGDADEPRFAGRRAEAGAEGDASAGVACGVELLKQPKRALNLTTKWAAEHPQELMEDPDLCQARQ